MGACVSVPVSAPVSVFTGSVSVTLAFVPVPADDKPSAMPLE